MAVEAIRCPYCQSEAVVKYGKASNGKARFRCQPGAQCGRTFLREYAYPGRTPEVKAQIIEMTLNGSGVRDIARVLRVSPSTVIGELKKRPVTSPRSTPPS
jgi:transposase-like protein